MNLMQFLDEGGKRAVGVVAGETLRPVAEAASVYDIALAALTTGRTLAETIATSSLGEAVNRDAILAEGRALSPIDHPDPAHLYVTGTGLTHLGSAATRDAMHKANQPATDAPLTDSMKMFRMGLEGGKPKPGEVGVQPEELVHPRQPKDLGDRRWGDDVQFTFDHPQRAMRAQKDGRAGGVHERHLPQIDDQPRLAGRDGRDQCLEEQPSGDDVDLADRCDDQNRLDTVDVNLELTAVGRGLAGLRRRGEGGVAGFGGGR